MALTAAQQAAREGKVTASFVPALVAGNVAAIQQKYLELIGDPTYKAEDLSEVWPVQLGVYLESFVLDWHQRTSGRPLIRRGEVVASLERHWLSCTLDAWREIDRTVIDCKVTGGHQKLDDVIRYYTPQMVVQRYCTEADNAALLIVHGGAAPTEVEIFITPDYERQILKLLDAFWHCVERMIPPVSLPNLPPPPEKWRKVNLDTEMPNWGPSMQMMLDTWQSTAAAAELHATTKDAIKILLPDDVGEVRAGMRLVKRARNRAVTIKLKP